MSIFLFRALSVLIFIGLLHSNEISNDTLYIAYRTYLDSVIASQNIGLSKHKREVENHKFLKNADHIYHNAIIFLLENMPESDYNELDSTLFVENIKYAHLTRKFEWCKDLLNEDFNNYVLPYAVLDEKRDNWRKIFYDYFSTKVIDCEDIYTAIDSVNRNVLKFTQVEYSTKRPKANQSPIESMDCKIASCTGLSIILCDAFRSVGIPSRICGVPLWSNKIGNHNWVEVKVDGAWHSTEYYPAEKLDGSWFIADAEVIDINHLSNRIYSTSFEKTNTIFPMVWNLNYSDVYGIDVSKNYLNTEKNLNEIYYVKVLNRDSKRVKINVKLFDGDSFITEDYSRSEINDINDILFFDLKLIKEPIIILEYQGKELRYTIDKRDKQLIINL
ncbi:MAG: transglutaminase domain-containing protein [Candidatus Delongbacteria bacterium]|nr:transglutaminase domain-containing protein [Candidatus Delongbacteria bacterium]MBN2833345.1 transglutaminase domain-containing protein [Candidatus Delongbacteria bacterium]